jgi:hypothetical protein
MKKVLSVFFLAVMTFVLGISVNAAGAGTGDLVVHYHSWDNDYTDLGSHAWGGTATPKETFDGTDDFGVYFEYADVPTGTEVGFIAVDWANGSQNWDAKHTGDVFIHSSVIIENEVSHVYLFEGAASGSGTLEPQYLFADPAQYNMMLVYYDPSGSYEETLGVHAWNGWSGYQGVDENGAWVSQTIAASWGSPDPVFSQVGTAADGSAVVATMLTTATAPTSEATPGLLIYAGGDDNKKTGDVNAYPALGDSPMLGEAGTQWVVSKGDAYTVGDNIYPNDPASFYTEAFSFRLISFSADDFSGTYAADPTSILVKLSATITNPYQEATTTAEQEAAVEEVEGWFTVTEVLTVDENGEAATYGNEVEIERVDFALSNTTLQDFAVVLSEANGLDNTKMYEISFNLGLEGDANKEAALMVAMDSEAPVIAFTSPASIIGQTAANRVIEIELGSDWNASWFPRYGATDNRDGDLTSFVYVPSGDYSTLNTGELGDYTIMLEVADDWGNVTQMTFIFRVVEGDDK